MITFYDIDYGISLWEQDSSLKGLSGLKPWYKGVKDFVDAYNITVKNYIYSNLGYQNELVYNIYKYMTKNTTLKGYSKDEVLKYHLKNYKATTNISAKELFDSLGLGLMTKVDKTDINLKLENRIIRDLYIASVVDIGESIINLCKAYLLGNPSLDGIVDEANLIEHLKFTLPEYKGKLEGIDFLREGDVYYADMEIPINRETTLDILYHLVGYKSSDIIPCRLKYELDNYCNIYGSTRYMYRNNKNLYNELIRLMFKSDYTNLNDLLIDEGYPVIPVQYGCQVYRDVHDRLRMALPLNDSGYDLILDEQMLAFIDDNIDRATMKVKANNGNYEITAMKDNLEVPLLGLAFGGCLISYKDSNPLNIAYSNILRR